MKIKKAVYGSIKASSIFVLANIIYLGTLYGLQYFSINNREKIRDKTHLEILLEKEKKNLNIQDKNIESYLENGENYAYSVMHTHPKKDTLYRIHLSGKFRDISSLKHECYHISDGDFLEDGKIDQLKLNKNIKRKIKDIKELYIDDLKATIYSMKK